MSITPAYQAKIVEREDSLIIYLTHTAEPDTLDLQVDLTKKGILHVLNSTSLYQLMKFIESLS